MAKARHEKATTEPPAPCDVHFPAGWPADEDVYSLACEHGETVHPDRQPA